MTYALDQDLWLASFESKPAYLTCPDCGGTRHLTALLYDGTRVTIDCEGCRRGYDPPTGQVQVYARMPRALPVRVTGVSVEAGRTEYHTAQRYVVQEADLFATEAAALTRAHQLAAEHDAADREHALNKEKPTKSWAWHVHYHRRNIREAERQIAYHTARLDVARARAKEPAE